MQTTQRPFSILLFFDQLIANRRLLSKFVFSAFGLLATLIANLFVARYIGPQSYGQYGFIVAGASFIAEVVIVTLPETYVFYLSANKYPLKETNTAYLILMLGVCLICVFAFALNISISAIHSFFWPNIDRLAYIIVGFAYILLVNVQQHLSKFGDCSEQYDQVEWYRLLSRMAVLLFVAGLWITGHLSLMTYFYALLASLLMFFMMFQAKIAFPLGIDNTKSFKQVLNKMYQGWQPISFYTLLTALYSFGGRYAIQMTSGSLQQGAYTYALFLALLPLAILAPMVTLYMSNMSKLYSKGLTQLFTKQFLMISKTAILLYGMFSFFLATNASQLIDLLSGDAYREAIKPLAWLAVFSFLHLFDLLGGNLYFCTERIKAYRWIVAFVNLVGIIVFIMLCAISHMSALNLSIIVTCVLAMQVGIQFYGNIRYLNLNFSKVHSAFIAPLLVIACSGLLINSCAPNFYWRLVFYTLAGLVFCSMQIRHYYTEFKS